MKPTSLAVLLLGFLIAAQTALGQVAPGTVDLSFNSGATLTRPVYGTALRADGKVLITGDFTSASQAAANGVALLQANGATDLTFSNGLQGFRVNGRAVALLLDGKVMVGGAILPDGGFIPTGLARLNPDGSIDDSFVSPVGSYVYSMAVQNDGKVLVAGSFSASGRRGILRLNTDGTVDNTFLYGLAGANGTVNSLALLSSGKIIVGGAFTTVNGSSHNGVARLNADGSVDETFNAIVSGVTVVAGQTDGKVVVGGTFTMVNGAGLNRIARLNADGTLDNSFTPGTGANGTVYSLSIQSDGKIVAGGAFSSIDGTTLPGLARLNPSGSVDGSFSTGPGGINGTVYSITPQPNGQTIVSGSFSTVGTAQRNQIARLGTSGSLDPSFVNGAIIFAGNVSCVVTQADGKILANSVSGTGIGRFLTNGAPDTSFLAGLSGANGPVAAIAVPSTGKIIVAGQFTQFNGVPARALARLDNGGGVDASFQNGIGGTAGSINALILQPDGRIVVGGSFTDVKGIARTNLARLNQDGSVDNSFMGNMAGVNGTVLSLKLQGDGKILVGGVFTSVNGVGRTNLARVNPDGSLDRTFQEGMAGFSGPVYAMAQQPDQKVVVAGLFTSANGVTVSHITRLLPDGSRDTNFTTGTISNPALGIRTLALQSDGRMLIGGDFTSVNGVAFNNIARLRTNGTVEAVLQAPQGANGPVTALTLLDNANALVGGGFGSFSGEARSYLVRIVYNTPAVPLEVALNNTSLSWTNDAVAPWQGQGIISHDGSAAAQSGSIADRESTSFTTALTGPGCLSYWWKVSSETNFDYLTFTCTGPSLTNRVAISGEVGWEQQTICIPAGVHIIKWTYAKDLAVSVGLDAAWVDEVTFTPGPSTPVITLNPLSTTTNAGDTVSFSAAAAGVPPLSYQWLFNGAEIPNATNAVYTITSLVPEQAGTYTVRISNDAGAATSSGAQLTVIPLRAAGAADYGQATVTLSTVDAQAISAGQFHSLILKRDGSIYAWGNNGAGQCSVPTNLGPALGIAGGGYHSLAIKADRTVAGWGDNAFRQATAPAGLTNVLAVAAGTWHSLALRENGTVVGWGDNSYGQATPPAGLSNIIAIAAGGTHSLALRADGIVFGWGGNLGPDGSFAGQASVPWGLNNVVAIGAGSYHSLAVKNDGTITGWGDNSQGELTVPTNLPPAVSIVGGGGHTVAVLADGTAAAWGENFEGQCNLSRTLTNVVAAAAGEAHTLLLFGQRPPAPAALEPVRVGSAFSVQVQSYLGKFYALEYKTSLSATAWTTLPAARGNGQLIQLSDPAALDAQRYYRVRQW